MKSWKFIDGGDGENASSMVFAEGVKMLVERQLLKWLLWLSCCLVLWITKDLDIFTL